MKEITDLGEELNRLNKAFYELTKAIYATNAVVAEIAYIAGQNDYFTGNHEKDISTYIQVAMEFKSKYSDSEWVSRYEYITTLLKFAREKLDL